MQPGAYLHLLATLALHTLLCRVTTDALLPHITLQDTRGSKAQVKDSTALLIETDRIGRSRCVEGRTEIIERTDLDAAIQSCLHIYNLKLQCASPDDASVEQNECSNGSASLHSTALYQRAASLPSHHTTSLPQPELKSQEETETRIATSAWVHFDTASDVPIRTRVEGRVARCRRRARPA